MTDAANEALARAREQLERAKERVRMLEAKETARERKRDTRRKIILGALLIERMGRQGEEAQRLAVEPLLASWNRGDDPEQVRVQRYLAEVGVAAPCPQQA